MPIATTTPYIHYIRFTHLSLTDLNGEGTSQDMEIWSTSKGVEVPMIQPQPVESIKRTIRTPSATRTPDPNKASKKKGKQIIKLPRSMRHNKNVALDENKILEEDVEKLVEGDEESHDEELANTMILSQEDPGTRLEPGSHKENLEEIVDDKNDDDDDDKNDDHNDDDDHTDHALVKTRRMGSSKVRNEQMHTRVPSPLRSTRTDLSSDKTPNEQKTRLHDAANEENICSQQQCEAIHKKVDDTLKEVVPKMATSTTNELVKDNLLWLVFPAHAPKIIKELFRIHMQNNVVNAHPTSSSSSTLIPDLQQQLKMKPDVFYKRDHKDHPDDDALPEGEKSAKRRKTSRGSKSARGISLKRPAQGTNTTSSEQPQQQDYDAWVEILKIDEDEVILEDETPELLNEFQNVDKRVPTIFDHKIMEATMKDTMSNQFKNVKEYAYHLEQAHNYMEN
ncbi:hypothetical protein Tco_0766537 [Tanacetum coccineum]